MKVTLFVFCLLLTTAAFAQGGPWTGGVLSAQPFVFEGPSHPAHAGYTALASETSVVSGTTYTIGQGDRPASDFPQQAEISLGDRARELRKQHDLLAKKAKVVWINQ
ncbi:MAG TPA: hypothetical protein VL983_03490 [Terriglobales bacterium]|nr:hypothetical protein [Terriglobales bacterium]